MTRLIYLVDDDDVVRDSAALLLRANGYEVLGFADAGSFLDGVRADRPGCVMLDIGLPGMDGLETQEQLNAQGLGYPVLILTGEGDIARAVRAMKNGAVEFLEKPYDEERLLSALDTAFALLHQRVSDSGKAQEARDRIARLSNRERQVMQGLLDGLPNKLIAYQLGLSIRTVESFRATLMEKLGVRSVSAAVRMALAAGLPALSEEEGAPRP
ncbi:MAG: response regulator transcription factor [Chakrabartia sp.]